MDKTSIFRDDICFLGLMRDIGSTNKLYIPESLNNIFMEYKDDFANDLAARLPSKRRVDHKIESTWKYINLQSSISFGFKQIGECKTQEKEC